MSVFRKPSFQFTGPDSAPSSPGWFARNLKRSNSNQGIEYKAHQLNTTEGGTRSRSGSVISLDSDYNGEFSAPEIPEKKSSTAAAITKKPSFEPVVENAPAPQTGGGAPSSHYRSLKPSNASSAFLSISPAHAPSQGGTEPTPLTSLYLVSGLPKSPQTWTLADPDSVMGVHHSEGAVGRWWRAEVLGSSVSPGVGKGEKKRRGTGVGGASGKKEGVSKADLGKMLSKALKVLYISLSSFSPHRHSSFSPPPIAVVHARSGNNSINPPTSFNSPHIHIPTPCSLFPPPTFFKRSLANLYPLHSLCRRQDLNSHF
jgi:hypothetical protein